MRMDRQTRFEAIVLHGIWAIIRIILYKDLHSASKFRSNTLSYLSNYGNQSDGAEKYREEETYKDINWNA